MAESKKILVAFDPEQPGKSSSDFLVPVKNDSGEVEFLGAQSKKSVRYGMVVLTSHAVTENDLFAKLIDTGRKVPNVADALDTLCRFLDAMKSVKIGNVIEIDGSSENAIALVVASNTPSGFGE